MKQDEQKDDLVRQIEQALKFIQKQREYIHAYQDQVNMLLARNLRLVKRVEKLEAQLKIQKVVRHEFGRSE